MSDSEYIKIQQNIRNYLDAQNKYSQNPFLAEFEVWSEYAFGKPTKNLINE